MSAVYSEASRLLQLYLNKEAGLKTLLFAQHNADTPSHKKQYKLVAETLRFKEVLDDIIDACKLHKLDKGLSRPLLLLLLYDLLFGSQRIEGGGHFKRLVLQNKTPIQSALARIYIKRQASTPMQLLPPALRPRPPHPRYVRINTVLCSRQQAVAALQADGWAEVERPSRHPTASDAFVFPSPRSFYRDVDIDGLLVFPPATTFHASALYERGWLVLQDKASCMSAVCLNPALDDVVVDACAAPGNKTSHLVAILSDKAKQSGDGLVRASVDAFEIHQSRFHLLTRLLAQKGVHVDDTSSSGTAKSSSAACVTAHHASFLSLKADDGLGRRVTAVLLDPTCSGSGMTHTLDSYYKEKNREAQQATEREETRDSKSRQTRRTQAGKKRRRSEPAERTEERDPAPADADLADAEEQEQASSGQAQSLSALSAFQLSLLVHAFALPAASHIVYSTCSHHSEENEAVIAAALEHSGRRAGWEVEAGLLPSWKRRGARPAIAGLSAAECERMVRCDADEDCMNGFFVCGLVRRADRLVADTESKAAEREKTRLVAVGDKGDGQVNENTDRRFGDGATKQTTTARKRTERKRTSKKRKKQEVTAPSQPV